MEKPDLSSCSIARSARVIGDEWILIVLRELFRGPQRFDVLQKRTGAATNILTNRLKRLVDSGLAVKQLYQERPPRYAYALAPAGLALFPVLIELMRFGQDWLPVDTPPSFRLRHLACGKFTRPGQQCSECGGPIALGQVQLVEVEAESPAGDRTAPAC